MDKMKQWHIEQAKKNRIIALKNLAYPACYRSWMAGAEYHYSQADEHQLAADCRKVSK